MKQDLDLSDGKMISQACHASLGAYEEAGKDDGEEWKSDGSKKVVLDAGDRELQDLRREASNQGLPNYLVEDAGLTETEPGTVTALGIGPAEGSEIDRITGQLRLIE